MRAWFAEIKYPRTRLLCFLTWELIKKSGGQLIADHRFGFFFLESSQTDYELQSGEVSSDGLDTFTSESKTADSLWVERQ